jgi:cytochrome c oxidase subunit IV
MSVYLNGKLVEHPHESHHHVSPVWQFTAVFVALLCLTILTYLVSFAGLGSASLPVAMAVATVKASLVIAFFMHLFYEDRVYAFLFLSCFIFVAIFFTFTLFDMNATDEMNEEGGIHYKKSVDDHAEEAEANRAFDAPAPKKSWY